MILSAKSSFIYCVLAVTALSGTIACSRPSADPTAPAAKGSEPWVVEVDGKAAAELVARAKLTCKESSECPESIALMMAITKKEGEKITYNQCTSFLVSSDVIATNSHCVPERIRKAGASCRGSVAFVFASSSGEGVRAECDTVVSATEIDTNPKSKDYLRKLDVAFLKLSKPIPNVKTYKFDRSGLPDGTALKVIAIDPVKKGRLEGSLAIRDCDTVQATFANPSYVTDTAGIATASGCDIRVGNSGAPAIDDRGVVRAVVFGVLPPEMMAMDMSGYETPREFQSIAYLSNAACLDVPTGVEVIGEREKKENCERRLPKESLRERAKKSANVDFEASFEIWKASAPTIFGYKLGEIRSNANNVLTKPSAAAAVCITDPAKWPAAKSMESKFLEFSRDGDKISASIAAPVWAGTFALDELYRVSVRAKQIDRVIMELEFDVKSLQTNGITSVGYKVRSEGETLKPKSTTANLKICTAVQREI